MNRRKEEERRKRRRIEGRRKGEGKGGEYNVGEEKDKE